jgi:hypothetical protein
MKDMMEREVLMVRQDIQSHPSIAQTKLIPPKASAYAETTAAANPMI